MNYARFALLASLVVPLAACTGDDDLVDVPRGAVDQSELTRGVLVTLSGNVGSVSVPFEEPVPDVSDADFQDEMDGVVFLTVRSVLSQAAAELGVGGPLSDAGGTPAAPGEYTWQLNGARDTATLTFFNETPSGLTLKSANPYEARLSITDNDYVEALVEIQFDVSVQ